MNVHFQGIEKHFGEKEVLKGATLTLETGKIYGLLGRNGAGKTTLFRVLAGEIAADAGEMTIAEDGITRPLVPEDVGLVQSQPVLPSFLTGREFLKFLCDVEKKDVDLDALFHTFQFQLEDADRLIVEYSHGMKSKINLMAMAILMPKILLLDEPLTSLDVVAAEEIKKFLRRRKDDTILMVSTHILDLARSLCDEIVLLRHGVTESLESLTGASNYDEEDIVALLTEGEDA